MALVKLNFLLILAVTFFGCSKPDKSGQNMEDDFKEAELAEPENTTTKSTTRIIEITKMQFVPDVIRANKGDTIVWINRDFVDHDVTEKSQQLWTSSRIHAGDSWKRYVDESQVYFCSLHVVMEGKIVVNGKDISMISAPQEITMCGR